MQKLNILRQKYTAFSRSYQLKLPLEIGKIIPDDDCVRLLDQIVEELDLSDLYSTYSKVSEKQASPRQMFKIMLYAYHENIFSSRRIECACRRDINFMYLLDGKPAPDHSTVARFRTLHFAPYAEKYLTLFTEMLRDLGEISGETIFIDGTKIEANANRYTFVWKKSVTKNQQKLMDKAADLAQECVEAYGLKTPYGNKVTLKNLQKILKKLNKIVADAGYESEENYCFLEDHQMTAMIKPADYEISKIRRFKADISREQNMEYDQEKDCYICKNGKILERERQTQQKHPADSFARCLIMCAMNVADALTGVNV